MASPLRAYTTRQVAELSGLGPEEVRRLARAGLVSPRRSAEGRLLFSFQDLVFLRSWRTLRETRLGVRRVNQAVRRLRQRRPEVPLSAIPLSLEGRQVLARDEGGLFDPITGQAAFDFGEAGPPMRGTEASTVRPLRADRRAADLYAKACMAEDEDPKEAYRLYQAALEADPDHADAHVNLGRLLHRAGRVGEAEGHYRQALDRRPAHVTALFNLGVVLEDTGRIEASIETYRRVLELDPAFADAHYNLAHLYERRGDRETALTHLVIYRRLVELDP